ncbi:ABC transporter ATP-binding protein [bacterium]|nr:ABC transporter ATP-binding protein [bacterium]
MAETNQIIEVKAAVRRFSTPEMGVITALDGVSLSVQSNEFITLLGPSGCGKTTFLRCISGFEELDEGQIFIDGVSMKGIPAHKRPVNTVFQNYALFPHLSISNNVGYSLDIRGVSKKERNQRVADVLDMVDLTGMERRMPHQLSGGQQQRVALARAIINRPKLLLLDEPLSALDHNLRQAMRLELKNLQHRLGISFIFVTHDQDEALTMSDRIVVLNGGHIQQIGVPTEIYDHPVNRFVAEFIGESNIFKGTVCSTENGFLEIEMDNGIRMKAINQGLSVGQSAELMIRPEHLQLVTDISRPDLPQISGILKQVVFVGVDYHLIVHLNDKTALKVIVRDSERQAVNNLQLGKKITFSYSLKTPHIITSGLQ